MALIDHEEIAVGLADHRRCARTVVDQTQLTDHGPGSEGGHLSTVAFHGDRTVDDDEGLSTGLSLVDDHRSGGHSYLGAGLRDEAELLLGARGDEWQRGEVPKVLVSGGHAGRVVPRRGVKGRALSAIRLGG